MRFGLTLRWQFVRHTPLCVRGWPIGDWLFSHYRSLLMVAYLTRAYIHNMAINLQYSICRIVFRKSLAFAGSYLETSIRDREVYSLQQIMYQWLVHWWPNVDRATRNCIYIDCFSTWVNVNFDTSFNGNVMILSHDLLRELVFQHIDRIVHSGRDTRS